MHQEVYPWQRGQCSRASMHQTVSRALPTPTPSPRELVAEVDEDFVQFVSLIIVFYNFLHIQFQKPKFQITF